MWPIMCSHSRLLQVQYCAKRMQSNFDEIWLLFSRNFAKIVMEFRGKKCDFFGRNFAEPHESSNRGRKFANLTMKFQLGFVRAFVLKEKFKNLIKIL